MFDLADIDLYGDEITSQIQLIVNHYSFPPNGNQSTGDKPTGTLKNI